MNKNKEAKLKKRLTRLATDINLSIFLSKILAVLRKTQESLEKNTKL